MSSPSDPHGDAFEGTRLESVEEIRQATGILRTPTFKDAAAAPGAETAPFRPRNRPALALLCILDDSGDEGEWVRLRGERYVIGRSDGDITIPHDGMMSSRHAELVRRSEQGRVCWHLQDLQSTNGTFVRVGKAVIKHDQEMLIGVHRLRFEVAQGTPVLVELTPQGEGRRFPLKAAENWIGRDPKQCAAVLAGDRLVEQRHARILRDAKGRWLIENSRSLNGLWLRCPQVPLPATGQFQLGEQRFLFRMS